MPDINPLTDVNPETGRLFPGQGLDAIEDSTANVEDIVAPEATLTDVMQMLHKHDQMLTWVCNTLNWMTGIFNGLQTAAAMMPGRAGKMAQNIMGGQNNGG